MNLRLQRRKKILLRSTLVFSAALTFYVVRFAPLASRIVGSWPRSDSDQTSVMTFRPNGEWELVTTTKANAKWKVFADGSGVGTPSVFKGHYSTWLNTFRTFDVKRYLRVNGKDVLWVPSSDCVPSNICLSDNEMIQMDTEASDPKYVSTIVSADWYIGRMTVRNLPSGAMETWTRQ